MVPLSVQGGGGRLRPCFPVSSFPSSRNPSPPFPNLEARLKLEIPAACPKLSEEHLGKCPDLPQQLGCTQLPSSAHTQAALHHCHPQPLCCGHRGMLPNPPHPHTFRYHTHPFGRQRQQQGNSSSPSQLCKPHPVPEPRVQVQTHPADFPTSGQLMQDSVPCLGTALRRMLWWVQPGHHLAAALELFLDDKLRRK